jgi:hypothetical protein
MEVHLAAEGFDEKCFLLLGTHYANPCRSASINLREPCAAAKKPGAAEKIALAPTLALSVIIADSSRVSGATLRAEGAVDNQS